MERQFICLLARFRCVREVIFGVEDLIDVDFPLENGTLVGSDCKVTLRSYDRQGSFVYTERAASLEVLSKTADEPFVPFPKVFHWNTAKLNFPLMGASTILSFGCWPRMRRLTLNLAWPGKTELGVVSPLFIASPVFLSIPLAHNPASQYLDGSLRFDCIYLPNADYRHAPISGPLFDGTHFFWTKGPCSSSCLSNQSQGPCQSGAPSSHQWTCRAKDRYVRSTISSTRRVGR